jgi:hypothetical protein
MLINIPEDVAQRLEKLAEEESSTVEEVLRALLNRYTPDTPPGSLAQMAQNARAAGLASAESVDTAERSREILNAEFADYLRRRMDEDADDDHHG